MSRIVWLVHLLVGGVIVLLGLKVNALLNEYSGLISVVGLGFGYYSTVLNYYYNRDPRIYGFVNRWLLLVRRDHTYWELSIAFSFEPRSPVDRERLLGDIEARLRGSDVGTVRVPVRTMEHMELVLDNLIDLNFRLEPCRLAVNLDRRLTVPVHAYAEYQKTLLNVAEAVQAVVKADELACDVQVFFRKGRPNPFYGFFVNRVPAKLLDTFHVVFRMDRCPDCRIEASQDHVGVHATSLTKMFAGLDEVLSYRSLPALVEAR